MIKRLVTLLIIALLAWSCEEAETRPEHILDEEVMVAVLTDVQLLESVKMTQSGKSRLPLQSTDAYGGIFSKHDVSEEEFKESMSYYSHYPEQLEVIYDRIIVALSERQAEMSGKKTSPVSRKDTTN